MQRTLGGDAVVEGVGLFTGRRVRAVLRPAAEGTGIRFQRVDLPGKPVVSAVAAALIATPRRTTIGAPVAPGEKQARVETIEHVLSALAGMGVDNALVEVDGPEMPIGDGSAALFADAIKKAGVKVQGAARRTISLREPAHVDEGDASIIYTPPTGDDPGLELVYVLDYAGVGDGAGIPAQTYTLKLDPDTYAREVAPARTFSTRREAELAKASGMFKHVAPKDFLVIGPDGPIDNTLRFPDECARHKLLDLLGDLSLAGARIRGRVVAVRSGHALNQRMAALLAERSALAASQPPSSPMSNAEMKDARRTHSGSHSKAGADGGGWDGSTPSGGDSAPSSAGVAMDVRQIIQTLPHRFPMLMVDRVTELEEGKRAVGIKNVSINEPFFQGHYPATDTRAVTPIMPGVLIIEAMAQLAGLMLHKTIDHEGKVALLTALEEVRLRRPVVPGDQLRLEAVCNKANSRLADVFVTAKVDGEVAAEARLKFVVVPPEVIR